LCERFNIETIVRAKVHLFEFKKRSVVVSQLCWRVITLLSQ
jgi:hypothetical protein